MKDEPEPKNDDKPKLEESEGQTEPSTLPGEVKPVSEMTPEEQMAAFEKALKEEDWGHQPC